ncbi:MAG: hypothetical protein JXD21_01595 [Candidatus Omnitrophica bacterium]|nr:hypothetical protein [Candidatus Omnitrophota bacterium]
MRKINWQIMLGVVLVGLSAAMYFAHYLMFHDAHHIFIYLVGDIAFVPVEVLLVTLIIHRLLHQREKMILLKKMNMVIGVFFSEVGTVLLKKLTGFQTDPGKLSEQLLIDNSWSKKRFLAVEKRMREYPYTIAMRRENLDDVREFCRQKKDFLLRLLENSHLLEHDSFTDLLWAVTHLTEELMHRDELTSLPDTDYTHLTGDIKRVYARLVAEWVGYLRHLKESYPYLFSLALRTNPFDSQASIHVQ